MLEPQFKIGQWIKYTGKITESDTSGIIGQIIDVCEDSEMLKVYYHNMQNSVEIWTDFCDSEIIEDK